jgi:hypothetical protein
MGVELPVRRIDFGYFVRPAEETPRQISGRFGSDMLRNFSVP